MPSIVTYSFKKKDVKRHLRGLERGFTGERSNTLTTAHRYVLNMFNFTNPIHSVNKSISIDLEKL